MADLKLEARATQAPATDRGRMVDARYLAKEVFHGNVSAKWVRENVPGKITLSHSKVVWFLNDVRQWISTRQDAA